MNIFDQIDQLWDGGGLVGKGCAGSLAMFAFVVGMVVSAVIGFNLGREYEAGTKRSAITAPTVFVQSIPAATPTSVVQSGETDNAEQLAKDAELRRIVEYTEAVEPHLDGLSLGLNKLGELSQSPAILNDEWRKDVSSQMVVVKLAFEFLEDIVPPSELDGVHRALLDGVRSCSQSMDYYAHGLDNFDESDIEAAKVLIDQCNLGIVEATRLFNEFAQSSGISADLGNR